MVCPRAAPFYIAEQNLVQWLGMTDKATDAFVNDAFGTAQVKDASDVVVPGLDSITMDYVVGSDGDYQGTAPAPPTPLTEGATYWLEINMSAPGGQQGFRRVMLKAKYHGSEP